QTMIRGGEPDRRLHVSADGCAPVHDRHGRPESPGTAQEVTRQFAGSGSEQASRSSLIPQSSHWHSVSEKVVRSGALGLLPAGELLIHDRFHGSPAWLPSSGGVRA